MEVIATHWHKLWLCYKFLCKGAFNYYVITKYPKFGSASSFVCAFSILVALSLLSNLQHSITTITTSTFTTISHKNSIYWFYIFITCCNLPPQKPQKNVSQTFPKFTWIQMLLIIRYSLWISLLILTKFKQID